MSIDEISLIKTKNFDLAKQKFNFYSRDPCNYTRARHARMAQFWLKIAHLSFSIATTPLLKMIPTYGLRPRLWLLLELGRDRENGLPREDASRGQRRFLDKIRCMARIYRVKKITMAHTFKSEHWGWGGGRGVLRYVSDGERCH